MFGDLIRWNPAEELSNWHRDIDELFGRFFQRPESSIHSWGTASGDIPEGQ